jgi:glycosyltransferase involved in cell wall biosynthesis
MWQERRIAVIVPAYDEGLLIARMLRRVPDFVDAIYVVDDASKDDTLETARTVTDERLRCLQHSDNRGVGAAIVTGYRAALAAGNDVLAVMAGDDQMDPTDLEAVVDPVATGLADYVKGNRFEHPQRFRMPITRRLAGRVLSSLTRAATGYRVSDAQCGYTASSRQAAAALPLDELWPRYGYPNDLLALLATRGLRVVEVPVRPVYADERSGVRPWHAAVVTAVIARRWWLGRLYADSARSTISFDQRKACSRSKQ